MRGLVPVTPDPVAFQLGPFPVPWYGLCYAVGLAVAFALMGREARRRGLPTWVLDRGMVIVLVAAVLGARAYHVIGEWDRYAGDPLAIVLPPYSGLGVLGAIVAGTLAMVVCMRVWRQSFWSWADVLAPAAFVIQAFARWGNFFNQELYGPPTDLPWAIPIECAYRVERWPCVTYPEAVTGFHPLFLYESVSGVVGALALLWAARRWGALLRPGDLFLIWLAWYSLVRFALEPLRAGSWTIGGIPTATMLCAALALGALAVLGWRHRGTAARATTPPPDDREEHR